MKIELAEKKAKELVTQALKRLDDIYGNKIHITRYKKSTWKIGITGDRYTDDTKPNPATWTIELIADTTYPKYSKANDDWSPVVVIYFSDPFFPCTAKRTSVRGIVSQTCKGLSHRIKQVESLYGK